MPNVLITIKIFASHVLAKFIAIKTKTIKWLRCRRISLRYAATRQCLEFIWTYSLLFASKRLTMLHLLKAANYPMHHGYSLTRCRIAEVNIAPFEWTGVWASVRLSYLFRRSKWLQHSVNGFRTGFTGMAVGRGRTKPTWLNAKRQTFATVC